MKTWATLGCTLVLLAPVPPSWACGVCVEDKVAATYDHAVVRQAAAKGKVVVFCEVQGGLDARRIRSAARRVRGVDMSSLRLSSQPAALSFALDPAQQSPQAAVLAMQSAAPAGTRLAIVRLIDSSAAPAKGSVGAPWNP
ncbi:MAG TPA: hypothetical protein VNN06_02020 [Ramlibacter sp.]|nr:hypothetical protein [Ramlibacter sp.]